MGADLYIVEISLPIQEWYEPLFEKAVRTRNLWPKGSEQAQAAQKILTRHGVQGMGPPSEEVGHAPPDGKIHHGP